MKRFALFVIAAAMLLSLCACGQSAPVSEEAPVEKTISVEEAPVDKEVEAAPVADDAVSELEERYAAIAEDELTWDYNDSTNTLIISGEGPMREYWSEEPEWYSYCDRAEHIVIVDGVTSVGAGAFWGFDAAVDAELGASVEFIGQSAFDDCCFLSSVNFPESLKYVGVDGFGNAMLHSDSGFILPEGLLYLGEGSFYSAFKESYVSIPASLAYIADDAFDNCFLEEFRVSPDNPAYTAENGILYDKDMTVLMNYPAGKTDTVYEVPQTVTTILSGAIEVTNTLETVVIPASVTEIGEEAIFWNYALTNIEVDAVSESYKSLDGVLFTKDGKELVCYPIGAGRTEYTVPEGCERICANALGFASGLTELTVPKSLTSIGESAFWCCDDLGEIHYAGTAEQWESIEIGENNGPLSDGSVTVSFAE